MICSLRAFAALLTLGSISLAQKPAPPPPAKIAQTPVPAPPVKYPPGYIELIQETVRAFNNHDFPAAIAAVDKAEKLMPPTAITLNTRGAIAVEQRQFDEGLKYLQQALKLEPAFYPALFNLGEIPLMQKQYAKAREIFQKMLADHPKDELLMFRVFLCHLLEKNDTAARQTLDKIPFPGDTPAYYFANAVWEFAHENPTEAKKWVDRGNWVFSADRTVNFLNSIYEIGWMQRPSPEVPKAAPEASTNAVAPTNEVVSPPATPSGQ